MPLFGICLWAQSTDKLYGCRKEVTSGKLILQRVVCRRYDKHLDPVRRHLLADSVGFSFDYGFMLHGQHGLK
jgi:hypothetical protein